MRHFKTAYLEDQNTPNKNLAITQASHRGGSASIPWQYQRILLWYEVILGQGFLRSVRFVLVRIIPPKLRIHISFVCHRRHVILATGGVIQ